jgi:hypothetical protein
LRSDHHPAAVEHERVSGEIVRAGAREEHGERARVAIGISEPAHRHDVERRLGAVGLTLTRLTKRVGLDDRADHVDVDPIWPPLAGETLGQGP